MEISCYGLTIADLRRLVYEFCEKNKIIHLFNKDNKMAGRDFVAGFLTRHSNVSLRKPEAISLNRVYGLNQVSVDKYFENLAKVLDTYNLEPQQIFNLDESGLSCVHKPNKVLAQKGKRVVSSTTSGERGATTTIVACCNAVGNYVPPMMIFKRKNKKLSLIDYAPLGTLNELTENGWINATSFMAYLQHFVKFIQPSKSYPVLTIMDNHKTHTKNLDLTNFARDSRFILLSLPSHTSHKLQPLNQTFFKPLKSAFNAACQSWMRSHPGRRIAVENLGELFKTAYLKSATLENAINGFKCTGIHPYNAQILPSSDFVDDPRCEDDTVDTPSQQLLSEAAISANLSTANEEPTCSS